MPFRNRVKRVVSRGSNPASSPTESTFQSQGISRIQSPTIQSRSLVDHDSLTIDPRENPLTLIESNATAKKRSTLSRFRSAMKKEDPYKNWPEHIYLPTELPRPKYRRPVDPEHKANLQAYSLRDAFANMRRNSGMSQYSPMGSRIPSRRSSFSRPGRSAFASRNHSIVELSTMNDDAGDDKSNAVLPHQPAEDQSRFVFRSTRHRGDTVTDDCPVPELVPSSSVDSDDVDSSLDTTQPVSLGDVSRAEDVVVAEFDKPFDEEELVRAFSRKLITPENTSTLHAVSS